MMNRRPIQLFLVPVVALSLSGCGSGNESSDDASANTMAASAPGGPAPEVTEVSGGDAELVQSADTQSDESPAANTQIVRASVKMHADEVPPTVDKVVATVAEFDGSVSARNVVNRDPDDLTNAYATLTVRIPPQRAEQFLKALESVGSVDSVDQSAQDVAGQLVDLDVRIKNAQASVDRIRELMETTKNIDELTRLENELTARQTALEQLEAQQKGLTDQTAMATIDISIASTESLGSPEPTDSSLGDAARTGWNVFLQTLYVILLVFVTLAPFLAVGVAIGLLIRWGRRRRTATSDRTQGAMSPTEAGTMPPPSHRDTQRR